MATIGVLTYILPPSMKLKNTSLNKIALSTLNSSHENKNAAVTKIKDIGMISGEVLMMRKKQKLVPLLDSTAKNIQQEHLTKRIKLSATSNNVVKPGLMIPAGKKAMPLPQAVARRNARERNRVKQVNNGFAALRERIPDEIAEAFEAAGNGRGSAKKLSKVETLRMAVEYIRSLERLLELDNTQINRNEAEISPSRTVIKMEGSCTPVLDDHYSEGNYDSEDNISYLNDALPDITTVNGQQYVRIPGTNTYQLITTEIFENEENIQPLATDSFAVGLASHHMEYTLKTGIGEVISPTIAPARESSVERLSGSKPSLPPADHLQHNQHLLLQLQMQQHINIKSEEASSVIYQNQLAPSSPPISEGQSFTDIQLYDGVVCCTLKGEIKEEVILETAALSEESMMEAIDWWDARTPQSDESGIL